MLKHIIMFKLKEEYGGKSREENAEKLIAMSRSLVGKIPTLRFSETHADCAKSPISFDVVIELSFDDPEGLQSFHEHPLHQELVHFADAASAQLAAVDYVY